jgi:hypothetical protein
VKPHTRAGAFVGPAAIEVQQGNGWLVRSVTSIDQNNDGMTDGSRFNYLRDTAVLCARDRQC